MKLSFEEIQGIISTADEIKPMVEAAVSAALLFGPELKKLLVAVSEGAADVQAAMFKRYVEEHGMNREEALVMTTRCFENFRNTVMSAKTQKSK